MFLWLTIFETPLHYRYSELRCNLMQLGVPSDCFALLGVVAIPLDYRRLFAAPPSTQLYQLYPADLLL